jgi:fatty acid desaturase
MPLTQAQEEREHELRVDQMTVNIEKMRQDMRFETWTFALQIVGLVMAGFAAGAAWVEFFQ